jgi:hypothetical protein
MMSPLEARVIGAVVVEGGLDIGLPELAVVEPKLHAD